MSETTDVVATHPLRVLHLEDSPRDAEMVGHKLNADGLACNIVVASGKESFEVALTREPFDLIISDYNLPGYDGITALKHAQETQPEVPVILISGTVGEEEAVKCLQIGATDYLLKQRLERLVPAVHRAIHEADRRRAQKRVEAALGESESRKAAILDSVLDCIVTMDAQGIVIEFNAAASRTFGYTKAEAIGRPLADLIIPPRFRDRHRDGLARYLATGEGPLIGKVIEIIAQRSDGSEIPVELAITVIGSGSVSIFTGVLRDITARKHADDTRARLAAIVDSSDDAIVSMTLDGTMLTWNAGAERLYGYLASEMIGQSGARLVPAEKRAELPSMMERATRGDAGEPVETQRLRKDGSVVNISLVISPMTDSAGHVTSVSTIARDIRLQKRAETDLLDRTNALEQQAAVLAEQAALLDLAQDAIIVRSMDNRISFWNCGAEAMYGWTSQEALGRDKEELLKSEFSESHEQIDATLLRDGRWEGEAIHHKRAGTPITVASRWTLQRNADGAPVRILTINNDITKRKHADAERLLLVDALQGAATALREGEERTNYALGAALMGVWELDLASQRVTWSQTMAPVFGLTSDQAPLDQQAFFALIHPDDRRLVQAGMASAELARTDFKEEFRAVWPDGNAHWIAGQARLIRDADNKPARWLGLGTDISERKSLEAQFRQAQKMEAIGQLAGGVAHDFNNLLTAILGYSNLVLETLGPQDARRADMDEVIKSGQRAAALTRQLLAFSRKQILQPTAVDLNALVTGIRPMLSRLIGEHVDLVPILAAGLCLARADPGQLEQVLMNLVVNARDAMPTGGRVTIETANVNLDASFRQDVAVQPGPYVMLAVGDSGVGMGQDTKRRLFEPFFTTKEPGKGTGLGLATVYGIVTQSGGYIGVESEPGHGATFKVYLPRTDCDEAVDKPAVVDEAIATATETVLIVEDEDGVRLLAHRILERAGYRVFDTPTPQQAEALFEQHKDVIDMLVTDVIMPGLSGPKLFERLARLRPDLKVLYVSGYTDDTIVHQGQLDPGVAFLQKPFTAEALNRRVREVLDR